MTRLAGAGNRSTAPLRFAKVRAVDQEDRMVRTFAALACLTACSTATLERAGLPNLEARIVASDVRHVYVLSDDGQTFAVPRRTLRDIDHPGNVLIAVGMGLVAFAGLTYTGSDAPENQGGRGVANLFLLAGVPMLLGGLIPWLQSSRAAANFGPDPAEPRALPLPPEPSQVTP